MVGMTSAWDATATGVLLLPSGRLIRGRGLGNRLPAGQHPEFGIYLLGTKPDAMPWESLWVRWPDFRLPKDPMDARDAFAEALRRSETERVELACFGGRGRTGTALACIAILDGVSPVDAAAFVRANYDARAIETRAQARYVEEFRA